MQVDEKMREMGLGDLCDAVVDKLNEGAEQASAKAVDM